MFARPLFVKEASESGGFVKWMGLFPKSWCDSQAHRIARGPTGELDGFGPGSY